MIYWPDQTLAQETFTTLMVIFPRICRLIFFTQFEIIASYIFTTS